jgi:hypothetical protein
MASVLFATRQGILPRVAELELNKLIQEMI